MVFAELIASLQGNPYFGAGFGLIGVGAGVAVLRKGSVVLVNLFRRHCMITLEVTSMDKSYMWLLQWMSEKGFRTQHMSVETIFQQSEESGKIRTRFNFVPSAGSHFFRYKNTWINVERNREKQMIDMNRKAPWESVVLTAIGRNRDIYFDILEDARQLALQSQEGRTLLYTAMGSKWEPLGYARRKRPLKSVILDEGISARIVNDVREFIESPSWYMDRGIPYRRGYLLHGPPGCGKSSYIRAIAGELDYSICVLNLGDYGISDDRLIHLLSVAPEQSIILLEDIDAAFAGRDLSADDPVKYEGLGRLTFSGLLNALDGVASTEGQIVFMTTNYLNRLDKALIRPGRVDVKQLIDYASPYQMSEMFKRFYPERPDKDGPRFATNLRQLGRPVSLAQIQGFFMLNKNSPLTALETAQSVWDV